MFSFSGCIDRSSNCPVWANVGYCQHSYVQFMKENCAWSCGCGNEYD